MAHPYHHAVSSARKYCGEPHEYLALHRWLDGSKRHMADFRHRVLTAVENGGAGRSKMVALGGVDLP